MKEAEFYELLDPQEGIIQCNLCYHHCRIKENKCGLCRVRENHQGHLYSLAYGKLISENVDPIEKKPIFHLLPGSLSFSIATVGCNFRCQHCQNYDISQYQRKNQEPLPGHNRTPQQVVDSALQHGCKSISYTYIEPTIFLEFAYETAVLAHKAGLKNIFVSNGYTSPEATRKFAPYLDANNIDLKAFTEKFYHEICGAKLAPVLNTIKLMKELGVWIEVTTLIIPGWNDSSQELRQIAEFIKSVDANIPWHVTRFYPTYKMTNRPATPVETLRRARQIGLEVGLSYVYEGNVLGEDGESTYCPGCGKIVIGRTGFKTYSSNLLDGACGACLTPLAGIFQ